MTTDQAVLRLEREVKRLRDLGHHAAAHDWQRDLNMLRSLIRCAEGLPPARRR